LDTGFSTEWIEKLKYNNDIVTVASKYINLAKKGKTWWACCPFHFEKTPSFAINEVEQYYHCFGCGASGDVIKFVEKYESLDFFDACKKLADYAGMELPEFNNDENLIKIKKKRDRIFQVLLESARFYYLNLKKPEAGVALEYLAKRKLDMQTVKEFGIGYSTGWNEIVNHLKSLGFNEQEMIDAGVVDKKDGKLSDCFGKRLIFPIFNLMGDIVGFSARVLEPTTFAKYKNTAQTLVFDKSKCIYGISQLKKFKQNNNLDEVVVVEGQMDVISLYKAGVKNAVACMGTALTSNHARDLKKFSEKIVLCFDGDSAGKKATLRSIEILFNMGLNVYIVTIPNDKDPDEYVNEFGIDAWNNLIKNALYWVEFLIKDYAKEYNLDRLEEKNKFVGDALNIIKKLPTQSEQEIYLKMVHEMTNISVSVLKSDLNQSGNSAPSKEDIVVKAEKVINLKENAYVKAMKFVISALIHKKEYAQVQDIREFILNPNYVAIFDYVKTEKENNRVPIVSKIFDMFDVENNRDVYDIVNYEFSNGEDNENYYNDCINLICKSGLSMQKEKLLDDLSKTIDPNEKSKIIKQIQEIVLKEKRK